VLVTLPCEECGEHAPVMSHDALNVVEDLADERAEAVWIHDWRLIRK
jgi:hypothetical protein